MYAASEVRTVKVIGKTALRHTSAEFIDFVNDRHWPKRAYAIHILLDYLSAHKTNAMEESLKANPKVRFHFAPTSYRPNPLFHCQLKGSRQKVDSWAFC